MLTLPLCTYSEGAFAFGLAVLQKQGNYTPEPNTVTVLLNHATGEVAIMPKGLLTKAEFQVRVNAYTLQELEELANEANPTDAEPIWGALMLLRPRLAEPNNGFYLFAESPNHIVVAPAPHLGKKSRKGFG